MKILGMALPMGVEAMIPTSLLVFPVGEPPANDGRKWRFTPQDLATVAANFATRTEPLPILYAHGDDLAKGRKAAGWVDSVEIRQEGLVANVRWTNEARSEIRSGEWGFRSPGFEGEEDEEGFIHPRALNEVSLVNDPAIGGMAPVIASTNTTAPRETGGEEKKMSNETSNINPPVIAAKKAAATTFDKAAILGLVREVMGIPDVIDDKTLGGLIASALAGAPAGDGEDMMPAEKKDAPAIPFGALAAKVAAQAKELAELRTSKEVENVIAEGVKELRLTPALVEAARAVANHGGLDALKAYVASLAPTAPPAGKEPVKAENETRTRHPFDFVGHAAAAFNPERMKTHQATIAYLEKANAAGQKITYRDALIATTRKTA